MRGRFLVKDEISGAVVDIIPNTIVDQGAQAFLKMITQADASVIASNGAFYVGLCSGSVSNGSTLSTLTGEPSTGTGYSRQSVSRSSSGWPSGPTQINQMWKMATGNITFSFSTAPANAITRMFISSASSGTSGTLFALSAALQTPASFTSNSSFVCGYELLL